MSCILHLIWQPQSCIGERYINKRGLLQTCVFCYSLRYLIKNHLQMLTDIIWDLWGLFSHHTCYFGSFTREGRWRVAVDKIRQPFLYLKCLGEHLSGLIWARAWRKTCRSWLLSISSPASLFPGLNSQTSLVWYFIICTKLKRWENVLGLIGSLLNNNETGSRLGRKAHQTHLALMVLQSNEDSSGP